MSRSTSEPKPDARAVRTAHGRRVLLATVGANEHDRAVALVARGLAAAGFVVTRVAPADDVVAAIAAASAEGTIVGLSVRGPGGLAALPALLAAAARGGAQARSPFVGGDFSPDVGTRIAAQHGVQVFARDATTREVVDWLLGEP